MKTAPDLAAHTADIQAMLVNGFGWLKASRFHLLTIRDPVSARAWLRELLASGLVKSAAELAAAKASRSIDEIAAVAFSWTGLRALGLDDAASASGAGSAGFPTPFRSGMGSVDRARLLRDEARAAWAWSDVACDGRAAVHLLLAHWWQPGTTSRMADPAAAFDERRLEGPPDYFEGDQLFEPFRFRDGLSQPLIRGLRGEASPTEQAMPDHYPTDRVTAPGEFILGHLNEYGEPALAPDLPAWRARSEAGDAPFGLNGSYLAVRQIEQHVQAFDELHALKLPGAAPDGYVCSLAEKIVGRRRDRHGTPLGWRGSAPPQSDLEANDFRYARDDAEGLACPLGAHVRRAHPRDALGPDIPAATESSKLHRLLRRGRPYRETGGSASARPTEGLVFIACNADLERQFEFVHQRWLRNPRFVELEGEDDPVVGAHAARFTVPALPAGSALPTLADYTTTRGGGYFFLPGMKALRFIAAG